MTLEEPHQIMLNTDIYIRNNFTGIDISENQIEQAKILAEQNNMNIEFFASPAEEAGFNKETFYQCS